MQHFPSFYCSLQRDKGIKKGTRSSEEGVLWQTFHPSDISVFEIMILKKHKPGWIKVR